MVIEALEKFIDYKNELVAEEFKKLNQGKREVVQTYFYRNSFENLTDYLIFDHVWSTYLQEIIDYLKELNISKFIFADTSTECFESMKILMNNGFKLSTIEYRKEKIFGMPEKVITGILVEM